MTNNRPSAADRCHPSPPHAGSKELFPALFRRAEPLGHREHEKMPVVSVEVV
jgi:hypothetical protein